MLDQDLDSGGGFVGDAPNAGPVGDPFADQLAALYAKYGRQPPTPAEIQAHRGNPGGLAAVEELLKASQPKPAVDPVTPPPTTDAAPSGTNAPPDGSLGSLIFKPPPELTGLPAWMPELPTFTPPAFKQIDPFVDPSMADVQSDPGYDFARSEGQRALEQSKAAQGVYNTGGTLKDLYAWGNNFAAQRYGDVRNRKKDTYLTNYQTQYVDPYQAAYKSAYDSFQPKLEGYRTGAQIGQRADEVNFNRSFDVFKDRADRVTDVLNS